MFSLIYQKIVEWKKPDLKKVKKVSGTISVLKLCP